jgi:hypothetical protein
MGPSTSRSTSINWLEPGILASWPTALCVAALLVAIPLWLHWRRRARIQVVPWAAMRLLRQAARPAARRVRWAERVLLGCRVAALLTIMIALAAAQPWAKPMLAACVPESMLTLQEESSSVHRIIVLDATLSMTAESGEAGSTLFDQAKRDVARAIRRSGKPGDGYSLIRLDRGHRTQTIEPTRDVDGFLRTLQEQRTGHSGGDPGRLLQQLAALLDRSVSEFAAREVHVFTDMHGATWTPATASQQQEWAALWRRIAAKASLHFVRLGSDRGFNLAVANMRVERALCLTHHSVPLAAEVVGYGVPLPPHVDVSLWVAPITASGTLAWEREAKTQLPLRPTAAPATTEGAPRPTVRVHVAFNHVFPRPGAYAIQLRVESVDGLRVDDAATRCIQVFEQLPVLFVEGSPEAPSAFRESRHLCAALDSPRLRIKETVVSMEDLGREEPLQGSIEQAACVFLCNVRRVPVREAGRLRALLERGGGVVFLLGDKVDIANYNQVLFAQGRGVLPVEILPAEEQLPAALRSRFSLDAVGYAHPLIQPFQNNADAGLVSARFQRYVRVRTPVGSAARTALRFVPEGSLGEGRDPALIEARLALGRVFVLTTPATLAWSSWPLNTSFLPLLQQILVDAVTTLREHPDFMVGAAVEQPLAAAEESARIGLPHGEQLHVFPDDPRARTIRFTHTAWSGLYRVNPVSERETAGRERFFTIGLDGVETPPTSLSDEEFRKLLGDAPFSIGSSCRFQHGGPGLPTPYLPQILILAVLGLLLAEGVLGGLTLQGQKSSAAKPASRGMLGHVARLVLIGWTVALAYVLFRAWWTGEFLAFLPSSWREGQETTLGLEQGERTWRLLGRFEALFLFGAALAAASALIAGWLMCNRHTVLSRGQRAGLAVWRTMTVLAIIVLLLPVWGVAIRGLGRPAIVVAFDDSLSMSERQEWEGDIRTRREAAAAGFAKHLQGELLERRGVRVRLYRVGVVQEFLGEFGPADADRLGEAIARLRADQPASRLGENIRAILETEHAQAVILFTDGIVTQGERLRDVAHAARHRGVPLFLAGAGSIRGQPTIQLQDLRVADWALLGDTVVFEAALRAQGLREGDPPLQVMVRLSERGLGVLEETVVTVNPTAPLTPLRFPFRTSKEGEFHFRLELQCPAARIEHMRNERAVVVLPPSLKVLYWEGYPRYEYRNLRQLMESQVVASTGQAAFALDVRLQDAIQDGSAAPRVVTLADLRRYDLVILGDVPWEGISLAEQEALRDYVRQGGGLLVLAGPEHFASLAQGPLAAVLPIEFAGGEAIGSAEAMSFIPTFVPATRWHGMALAPLLEKATWPTSDLTWCALGYRARPEAEVLAYHRGLQAKPALDKLLTPHPLMLTWLPGKGRCLFLGIEETWRWRTLEGEARYDRFWLQTIRFVARIRQGPIAMSLEQGKPFKQGDRVRVMVRFPPEHLELGERVLGFQRRSENRTDPPEFVPLRRAAEEPGLFEAWLHGLEPGTYRAWLSAPERLPRPEIAFDVVGYPREADPDQPQADIEELEAAAAISGGRHTSVVSAHRLLAELPQAKPFTLRTVRHLTLWDHPLAWSVVLFSLVGEWLARRRFGVI